MGSCVSADAAEREINRKPSRSHQSDRDSLSSGESFDDASNHSNSFRRDPRQKSLSVEQVQAMLLPEGDFATAFPLGKNPSPSDLKDYQSIQSWHSFFLTEHGQVAIASLRAHWYALTGSPIDLSVKQYCGEDQDRWLRFFVKQLVVDRYHVSASRMLSLRDIDDVFLQVVCNSPEESCRQVPQPPPSASEAPTSESPSEHQPHPFAATTTPRKSAPGSHSSDASSHENSVSDEPSLSPAPVALPTTTTASTMSSILQGTSFPDLMQALDIRSDVHLMYLCYHLIRTTGASTSNAVSRTSSLRSLHRGDTIPLPSPNQPMVVCPQPQDEWAISLTTWRLGWIVNLLQFNRQGFDASEQRQCVAKMTKEFDGCSTDSVEYQNFYQFMWSFTESAPSNTLGTPSPSPVKSSPSGQAVVSRKMMPKEDASAVWSTIVPTAKWGFIQQWTQFLEDEETLFFKRKVVNADQWKQFVLFMPCFRSMSDFESYDAATGSWPSAFDEFVEWVAAKQK